MSALRCGRRAAGLRRALWPKGHPCFLAEEGTLGGVWGRKRSLSASACEQDRRKGCGHAELLEVLEARVRQLQAEGMAEEVMVKRVAMAQAPEAGGIWPPRQAPVGAEGAAPVLSSHWVQKLDKDQQLIEKRLQQLEGKLPKIVEKSTWEKRLRMEPRLLSRKLAGQLQQWERKRPQSPWEEQLARLLQEAPKKLSREADEGSESRLEGQRQKLLAFLECCLLTGHLPLAHHVLVAQHSRAPQQQLLTLPMYNTVMLGWARQGSFKELMYVFFMLKDAGLAPDLLSYAAALQCMGRLDQDAGTIRRCLKQMEQDGLSLQGLFSAVPLSTEEREELLRAVRKARPAFSPQPPPPPPPQVNTSPLLQEIYAKDPSVSYPKLHLPLKELQGLFRQQLGVEMATTVTVESVEKAPLLTEEVLQARKTLAALRAEWESVLSLELQETKESEARAAAEGRPSLFPYLCLLSEKELVGLLLQTLQALPSHGESLFFLAHELGVRVLKRKRLRNQVEELEQRYFEYLHLLASDTQVAEPCLPRQHWEALGVPEAPPEQPWPVSVLVQLGKQLAEVLVRAVQMPSSLAAPRGPSTLIPVLYHVYSFRSFRQIGILKPHPAFTQLQETAAERTLIFESTEVPMLCPPLPWTSPHSGAFLLSPTKMMRSLEGTQQHQLLLERCPPAELHGALDALTQLGNCAWRVNGRVLDLVLDLFRDKGCPRLGVPAPPTEAPRPPEGRQTPKGCLLPEASPADKAEMRRELARRLKVAREMQSLRADALYRLSLAQHLRNHVFWLPHNMDFRGRTYPCSPHFNHLGSDLARALLEFAQGRPLGPHGLDWLKIHLINLTGLKKRESLQTRRDYADAVMEDILDSAERPMTGRKWWMEADEPWQTLACCMEIAQVVHSPDPTTYISHFPVHQDGSCNGLQHYAALGRDSTGATSVNLSPSDLPQDVYSEVAAQVEVFRRQDAKQGVRVAQVLEGFISRKVVKQTVMTVVYGVTRYGGRLQIEKRLRELEDFPQEFVWEASHYLVRQVFNSLQEMFSGTRSIQRWLTESARLISLTGSAVEWITPLGVPIIQPYHRDSKVMIKGGLQSLTFSSSVDTNQKPNTLKQKNGFPPNFIHSLDSTHMMLTALYCYRKGLTFVSVHDCFWTHAADVGVMNQVCREQFVRLHSQPILHDLSRFLIKRFCSDSRTSKSMWVSRLKDTLLSVPPTGTFDLDQVKRSTFFFS
ncbi:DNA-directed RNA polymerase, mitochondrial isoform X2 [Bos indicus x Bos taurus]|uniref:DNA-directed RNA polymerase, mitochondrial isoform X2 n=1 Tax=Bos indicus x Bos taurus TaxID=30522 RepID=UPI0009516E4D|nr:PREDICTED: DNA-directed RNA polymerase, mitochondrial [Bos indicus]XP_027402504.1 DNA-directed RNA polymerase, mitochondrial isoform X2 [Bos indicus x Bos taurus]